MSAWAELGGEGGRTLLEVISALVLLALEGAVFWEGKAGAAGAVCTDILLGTSSVVLGLHSLCPGA